MNAAEQYGLAVLDLTLPALTFEEQARIKIADLLEMHEFGRIEELMGNRLAAPVTTDTLAAALRKAAEINQISTVENWLLKQEDSI
jgi:hypothetical protein